MKSLVLHPTIEPHVHPRGFEQAHKETFETASRAAIAGGVGTIQAMPNYEPLDVRPDNIRRMRRVAQEAFKGGRPYCDVRLWATYIPGRSDSRELRYVAPLACGIKFYVEPTQGNPAPVAVSSFKEAAGEWHASAGLTQPIAAHVEDASIDEAIDLFARRIGHPLYIPHINNRYLVDRVIAAKREGLPVYAATTIDHLFMNEEAVARRGWFARMKPLLATPEDQEYMWENLEYIDVIETDHAPHTISEKERANELNPEGKIGKGEVTCFGTPNLEAVLPVLVTAVLDKKLTIHELHEKTVVNPARIFGIKLSTDSSVKIVRDDYEFSREHVFSKCGWNSFEGYPMKAKVTEVVLRKTLVFKDGRFTANLPVGRLLPTEA